MTSSTVGFSSNVRTVEVGVEAKEEMELMSTAIMAGLCWTGLCAPCCQRNVMDGRVEQSGRDALSVAFSPLDKHFTQLSALQSPHKCEE